MSISLPLSTDNVGFHRLPSPRSKKSGTPLPSETSGGSSPLGLKSPPKHDKTQDKLLKDASEGRLDDKFQKSIVNGVMPDCEDIKATDVKEMVEKKAENQKKLTLVSQLLQRLAINKHHQKSPPNSPTNSPKNAPLRHINPFMF